MLARVDCDFLGPRISTSTAELCSNTDCLLDIVIGHLTFEYDLTTAISIHQLKRIIVQKGRNQKPLSTKKWAKKVFVAARAF